MPFELQLCGLFFSVCVGFVGCFLRLLWSYSLVMVWNMALPMPNVDTLEVEE